MINKTTYTIQGRRQKNFQGGAMEKKAKKYRKIALLSLFRGGNNEKNEK